MTPCNTSSPDPWWTQPLPALRAALFYLALALATFAICPLMVYRRREPFAQRYGLAQRWVRFVLWSLERCCGLRFDVQGREHIPAQNGVILAKHQSAWETIALQTVFPDVTFVLKRELLDIPVWGKAMDTCEPIAIDRGAKSAALKQLLAQGEARLQQGRWVMLFPEGTRVPPGQRGKYAASGGMLAKRAGCPVVPVAHNAGEFWPRNSFLKRPGVIQVRVGPPIGTAELSAQDIVAQAEAWIEAQMADISGGAAA